MTRDHIQFLEQLACLAVIDIESYSRLTILRILYVTQTYDPCLYYNNARLTMIEARFLYVLGVIATYRYIF